VLKKSRCILFAKHLPKRGRELFARVRVHDVEGIVAKWKDAPYNPVSWIKVKNPIAAKGRIVTNSSNADHLGRRRSPSGGSVAGFSATALRR